MNCPNFLVVTCLLVPHLISGAGHAVTGDFLGSLANGIRDASGARNAAASGTEDGERR